MNASSFREAGWVWEGLATHGDIRPTIYGVGEGYRYFGVSGVNYMFHPNQAVAFRKLAEAPRVVADLSKWQYDPVCDDSGYQRGFTCVHDPRPERIEQEAENLSRLALEFPNLVGGIIDDASGMFGHDSYGAGGPAAIRAALHRHRSDLELWVVIYASQLGDPQWDLLAPYFEVVNLWLWRSEEIPHLADHVRHAQERFPDKEIIVGSYLHDYTSRQHMPLDLLREQYETMLQLWEAGEIAGYDIIGGFFIDQAVEQAEWVREFLART